MAVFKLNDVFAGRYVLSSLIGEGGFSEVWKAHDQMAEDAVVAVKIYAPEKGLDDYGVRQFRREFSLTHHLFHPHLLRIHHFDISEGSPYLIMPYCQYGSLNRLLTEDSPFTERQVALVLSQIGSALNELHTQDPPILHQDIKPDNILIMQPETFMLADFGISSQIRHNIKKTTSESVSEAKSLTVAYAPPERFDRYLVTDASGDIFSLGVTLFELCTKKIPWEGSGGQSLLKGGYVPNLPEEYSPQLNNLLQDCMSSNRGKRPSAAELHARGKNFLETGKWTLPKPAKKNEKSVLRKAVPVVAAAAVTGILAYGAYTMFGGKEIILPETENQKLAASPQNDQEVKSIEEKVLEEELKNLARRTVELEEANKRLLMSDSANRTEMRSKEKLLSEYKDKKSTSGSKKANISSADKPAVKTPLRNSQKATVVLGENTKPAVSGQAAKSGDLFLLPKEFEKHLNRISDPGISAGERAVWKQKTQDQFTNGPVRIVDETEEKVKQYSSGIFLNLLYNVPHQIVVKELKRDENKKITEVRLTMQPKKL